MNVVILQPSYVPWRGYFHQIYKAELFIFYDDVQYDKHGWRNRNRIKTPYGTQWLTIPVHGRGAPSLNIPINQIRVNWDTDWSAHHWNKLEASYRDAPFFQHYTPLLKEFFSRRPEHLADFTIETTLTLARELGIDHTRFLRSSSLKATGKKTDRLVELLTQVGATHYISGPAAKNYLETEKLQAAGITLEFMQYDYPEYPQLYPPYDPQVSILDLLFMTGPEALQHIIG